MSPRQAMAGGLFFQHRGSEGDGGRQRVRLFREGKRVAHIAKQLEIGRGSVCVRCKLRAFDGCPLCA